MISELMPEAFEQPASWSEFEREKRAKLWKVVDSLNTDLGINTVRILSTGPTAASWKLKAEHRSPRWTTRREELPNAKAK
jgi:DNA polymerase V